MSSSFWGQAPNDSHWLDRLTRYWTELVDTSKELEAEAVATVVDAGSDAEWATMKPAARESLERYLRAWKHDRLWLDQQPRWGRPITRWLHAMERVRQGTPQPMPPRPHWLARMVRAEHAARGQGDNPRALLMARILTQASELDWLESGLDLVGKCDRDGSLLHRAAHEWPEALPAMVRAKRGPMEVDDVGRTVADVVRAKWDLDAYKDLLDLLDATAEADTLQRLMPPAPSQERARL